MCIRDSVVYIDRQNHKDVIQTFYELNNNWQETYKYTHGDTAAFWLSFVMNNKPFSINPDPPLWHNGNPLQTYKKESFYLQKIG